MNTFENYNEKKGTGAYGKATIPLTADRKAKLDEVKNDLKIQNNGALFDELVANYFLNKEFGEMKDEMREAKELGLALIGFFHHLIETCNVRIVKKTNELNSTISNLNATIATKDQKINELISENRDLNTRLEEVNKKYDKLCEKINVANSIKTHSKPENPVPTEEKR